MIQSGIMICLILIAYKDGTTRRIPDGLTVGMGVLGILSEFLVLEMGWCLRLLGATSVSGLLLLLCLIRPGCFGGGDVKLAAACGLVLGLEKNLEAFVIAVLAAGGYAAVLLVFGKLRRDSQIPFGPFLCLGGAISFLRL